jgi:hypothetical protein
MFQTETSTSGTPAVSSWRTTGPPAPNPEDEHFVPPPPPPLPRLEPLTKAAWAGLFGGPVVRHDDTAGVPDVDVSVWNIVTGAGPGAGSA